MSHVEQCKNQNEKIVAAWIVYVQKWPHYCRACNAAGAFYYPASYNEPENYESCETCTDPAGSALPHCPRCACNWDPEQVEPKPCPNCGYNHGKNPGDLPPPEPFCICPMFGDLVEP